MACLYRVYYLRKEEVCEIRQSSHANGAENQTASVPEVRSELKVILQMVLLIFCVLLVAAPIFFSIYYGVTSNRKEQELEELKIANYNLTSNNSALSVAHAILQSQYERNNSYLQESRDTLQSQYTALNKKHEELAKEFSKLQEYYCDGTNTSHENTCRLCKVGWIPFGSKCYFISITTLTWNESRDWCLTKGGQLVNIESLEEWVCHLCRWT
ncbi:B-cell differentiation antigen CD72-like [Erpetoichthys calabaricus]|uniref:B-cell differentiation antigen CD72-like n=1 Tax=Erpetoichthys calabaricus TaxID=27687 RepID=UPI002234074B|nr:B-cell differentiation antigen CD72-like [Erpetoichthys calabaricus]